ncbi:putative transport protein HsrA [Streptomyces sp. ADI95-16]|uniref:MFS transporter n=1 Tax=Streptomyces sp. ADI95-16 TaxID=1522758 RepID=UPI000F3A857E|nr:MFS transporter [Streptomyces sp. ADI95-16]AYV29048.1 putative transport protein HsrA [Streptomyces sp. ADI95-16]
MAGGLGTTVTTVQWVSTGYLLTVAFAAPLSGRLRKRYGGKRVWLGSVALFVAASALCGPAWSGPSLIAFRLLQGIGGGLMQPVGQALAARIVPADRAERDAAVRAVALAAGFAFLAGYVAHALRTTRTPLLDLRRFAGRPWCPPPSARAAHPAGPDSPSPAADRRTPCPRPPPQAGPPPDSAADCA